MTTANDAVPLSEETRVLEAKAFLAHVDSGTPQNGTDPEGRTAMKRWIWESVKLGYRPALLPDTTTYTREETTDDD